VNLETVEGDLPTTKALHENQLATFVDARVSSEFEEGHIEGALNISPTALEANSSLFALDVIDPTLPIVIYCGGGDCDDSHRVAELLQDLRGFEQTHVFTDGYQAWADAGLPTSAGPDPFAE
ncbi:MAG: rhodanese-like domain-containing protein, partial [Planctomycetota bacterium]